jgi:hypothetical protein
MRQDERIRASLDIALDVYCGRHARGFKALADLCRSDFWFRDPFVEIRGFEDFKAFLRTSSAYRQETKWVVSGSAVVQRSAYVRWHYVALYRDGASLGFDGMSELGFDDEGLLAFQIDFWDSAEALAVKAPALRDAIRAAKNGMHI